MRKLITTILVLVFLTVLGQKTITPTNELVVTGLVKNDAKFTIADIQKLPSVNIPDMIITNHIGEPHGTSKQIKGILVKELLKDIELKEDNPKLLSEFYFTFIASDNYKVVYSWNEIFNSSTGDHLYIVASIEGESLKDMRSRILVVTPTDYKTGRRYIKALSKIVVDRVDH